MLSVSSFHWLPRLTAVMFILGTLLGVPPVLAANERPDREMAMTFMSDLVAEASAAMNDGAGTLASREAAFRDLLGRGFHMELIAQVSLGKFWRRATPPERDAYVALFREFVLKSYGPRLASFDPKLFEVKDAVERGEQDVLVKTHINRSGGNPLEAGWRIRLVDGKPKIVDIVVEGVSMAINQRSEFVSVASRSGMTGLMEMLRARTQRLSVQSAND
jgi:phospholipid transport system substrate-binding protein